MCCAEESQTACACSHSRGLHVTVMTSARSMICYSIRHTPSVLLVDDVLFFSTRQRVQRLQIFQIRGVAGGFLSRANKSPHPSSVLIPPSERVRNAFPAENKVFGKSSRRRERYERRCNSFPVVTSRHAEAGP